MHQTGDEVIDFTDPHIRAAWMAAWMHLRGSAARDGLAAMLPGGSRQPPSSPLTAIIIPRARAILPALVRSTRRCDIAGALSHALPLIGAGPGLTPSWDDLLVAYLCGLRASSSNDARCRFVQQFGMALGEASVATTEVSRAYICRTIQGMPPPWIETPLTAICAGHHALASSATALALGVGHTSGTDAMLGLVLGTSVWQDGNEADEVLSALGCPAARKANGLLKVITRSQHLP